MLRVIIALFGMACGFAALVVFLQLGQAQDRVGWAAAGIFVGVIAAGYPVLYQFCKRQWWEIWRYLLLGFFAGGLCALPFAGGPYIFRFLLLTFVLVGAILGLLFWLAAIWRNADLTCPKSFCLPCGMVYQVARRSLLRR